MEVFQKTEFKKSYKKLHQNQKSIVNSEIRKIIENPSIGVEKVGDLKGISPSAHDRRVFSLTEKIFMLKCV